MIAAERQEPRFHDAAILHLKLFRLKASNQKFVVIQIFSDTNVPILHIHMLFFHATPPLLLQQQCI